MFYGQIQNGVLKQIWGVDSSETLASVQAANHDSTFIQTQHFGGASEYYFDGAAIVPKPDRPGPFYHWDDVNHVWYDTQTLDQIKAAQWTAIKAAREAELTSQLTTPYGAFDATVDAQKSITDAIMMLQTLAAMGSPTSIDFTLADNSVVTLTTEQMITVGLLLGQRTQQLYAKGRVKRDALAAATNAAEVEAVVW